MEKYVEVKINWEGKEGIVKLRRITFGEYIDILRRVSKTKMVNGSPYMDVDYPLLQMLILKKSIVEAPFNITDDNISKLDVLDGIKLMEVANDINSFQEGENTERDNGGEKG